MKARINRITVEICQGDTLSVSAAAVVVETDTNLSLSPYLLQKAGPDVQRACREIGWCDVGSAVITGAGWLPFERIIHAVGPRWGEGSERARLASVTMECLRLAETNRLKSLVLPAISTGPLGYPAESCARTMLTQIVNFTFEDLKHLKRIVICVTSDPILQAFQDELGQQLASLSQTSGPTQAQA